MASELKTGNLEYFKGQLEGYTPKPAAVKYGIVRSSSDSIVNVEGLSECMYDELIHFEGGAFGIALELSEEIVNVVLLSEASRINAGTLVTGTGRVASVGVGDALLGRVVNPLGQPIDGETLHFSEYRDIEVPAPSIMDRSPVKQSLETGILAVDSMIPIGRGQRELIIGDRQTGKTAIALQAVKNQKGKGVICIYCAIGQKASSVASTLTYLRENGCMEYSLIVSSTASDSSALQYIAPYSACAIAEHFMHQGKDVLIIYDDLSKHAVAYREMSLLLRRPSGREAYPGDVFYLHSRLLERAAKLSAENGGGSITALPIVETMSGDISAYIPTNVISITDGQIYLETDLFNAGQRPAVNVGLSVSRVGSSVQAPAMKKVSGNLRLNVAQYKDLAVFAQFGADIDASTAVQLTRGEKLQEILKQSQNTTYSLAEQTALLYAYEKRFFDDFSVSEVSEAAEGLLALLAEKGYRTLDNINNTGQLSDEDAQMLIRLFEAYKKAGE